MNLKTAIEILEYHQKWRLGKRDDMIHEPKKLTEALNILLKQFKNNGVLADVSNRTFTQDCTEVEDMAEQINQFIAQHALAKPATYSRKLRIFIAHKLNEYGG